MVILDDRYGDKPHFSYFLRKFYKASQMIARSTTSGDGMHMQIIGDGSPSYMFDNRQWPRVPGNEGCSEPRVTVASHIHHLNPKARILFILRNPVDRSKSLSFLSYKARKVGANLQFP